MIELLNYQFFQNAIIGGILIGIISAWIGLFLVLKKESMIVDGAAHTAFGGLALGLLIGIDPFLTALIVSIISIFLISHMRSKGHAYSDSAIALMLAVGFSIGLAIISVTRGFGVDIFSFLFGSILTISREEIILITLLATSIAAFLSNFHREILAIIFNEDEAKIMGIPVRRISICFNLMIAVAIILSIKMVGTVLVVALMVIPALAALRLKCSFIKTLISSITIAIIGVISGIIISAYYRIATSAMIVLILLLIYMIIVVRKRW
ncbi:MAG: metal ABC transporter permease [Candidatus Methanomethyliaceae archaeon]|nr:metal ABC transporter permease [Candidatus Methanomethyliaceae archaeon]MDW7970981.1 metal ABC transporter permease [Nitrososphaerota archaeon]